MIARSSIMVASFAMLLALPASAYIPGAKGIVRRFAEMQAQERVTPSPLSGSARFAGRAAEYPIDFEVSREGCRVQLKTSAGASVATLAKGKTTTSGPAIPALEALVALACPLLTFTHQPASDVEAAVLGFASGIGVNTSVVALSRVNASTVTRNVRFGYVIGARGGDAKPAQIWFDHDTYRPMRVIAHYGGRLWDVRLVDGGSIATNGNAPRSTVLYADGVRQMDLRLMATTPVVPSEQAPAAADDDDSE